MKGFRFCALVGSFSIVAALTAPSVLAGEPAQAPDAAGAQPGQERGFALDQLFTGFQKSDLNAPGIDQRSQSLDKLFAQLKKGQPKPVPTLGDAPPAAHTSSLIAHSHNPAAAHKKPSAHGVAAASHHAPAGDQIAVYHDNNAGAMMAVAHPAIASDATSVIAATLDRPGAVPQYKSGDHMVITLKALQDCNILVFDFDNQGNLTRLFPNDYEPDGSLHAGQTLELGGQSSKYTLDVDGNGLERIFIYASPLSDAPITLAMNPVPNTPFRAVNISKEQYDLLVNQSKTFAQFDELAQAKLPERSVRVTGKPGAAQLTSATPARPNNKVELVFQITNQITR